jgi:hypothetical protein
MKDDEVLAHFNQPASAVTDSAGELASVWKTTQ